MPEISVIVPVYNAEQYLDDCINSIVSQSFSDFELILLPGSSADNSTNVCEQWAAKDSRIKIIDQDRNSVSYARNKGIAHAVGRYLCFCDADDLYTPDFLMEMYEVMTNGNLDIVECGFFQASSDLSVKKEYENTRFISLFGHDLYERFGAGSIWKCMIRKDYWISHKFSFPERQHGEDLAIYSLIFSCTDNVHFLAKPLYIYRNTPASLSKIARPSFDQQVQSLKELFAFSISEMKRVNSYDSKRLTIISQMEHYYEDAYKSGIDVQTAKQLSQISCFALMIKNLTQIHTSVFDLLPMGWGTSTTGVLCQLLSKCSDAPNTYIKEMPLLALSNDDIKDQFVNLIIKSTPNIFILDYMAELSMLKPGNIEASFNKFKVGISVLMNQLHSLTNPPAIFLIETNPTGNSPSSTYELQKEYLKLLSTYTNIAYPKVIIINAPCCPNNAQISGKEQNTYYYEQIIDHVHRI